MIFFEFIGILVVIFAVIFFLNNFFDQVSDANFSSENQKRKNARFAEENLKPENIERENKRTEERDLDIEFMYMYVLGGQHYYNVLSETEKKVGFTDYWTSENRSTRKLERDSDSSPWIKFDIENLPWDKNQPQYNCSPALKTIDDLINVYDAPIEDIARLYIAFESGDLKYGIPDDNLRANNEIVAKISHWLTEDEVDIGRHDSHQSAINQIIVQFEKLNDISKRRNVKPLYSLE